jgi:cell wall-associated NlpC family hydrolase
VAGRGSVIDSQAGSATQANPSAYVTSTGATTTAAGSGSSIVTFARNQIGRPYIFGGTGNPGWDCSGLVQAALATVGVNVAHHATAQYFSTLGKPVRNSDGSKPSIKNVSSLVPGDIVFPYPPTGGDVGHVAIYSGNGNIIEAAKPGTNVREIPLYALYDAKRFA